jgi:hypothetical protein
MHVARSGLGVAVVNGKIYAIGGYTAHNITGANEEYDPITDSWIMRTPMPTPKAFFAITVYQNQIYCIGGNNPPSDTNEVYDPATDKWQTKAPMPTPRYELQANAVNGKIYCIGGTTSNGQSTAINEVYAPSTDKWSTMSLMPKATTLYASATVNNRIYIIGGFFGGNPGLNQIYDPQTDTWSEGAPPPNGSGGGAATSGLIAPLRIYVVSNTGLNQIYNPLNDSWTLGSEIPIKNYFKFGVAALDDKLFVVGGATWAYLYPASDLINETVTGSNEEYTPIGYGSIPPIISITSPEKANYATSDVSLSFVVNKLANWVGYSLDGQQNVTITGNATLTGLSNGLHNITVYANDTFGNMGASETATFTVAKPEPFPTALVATAFDASAAVACLGLLLYFKKRKH